MPTHLHYLQTEVVTFFCISEFRDQNQLHPVTKLGIIRFRDQIASNLVTDFYIEELSDQNEVFLVTEYVN